ncbi:MULTISPECIES: hypothetical protein [unclassified Pseudomonas]|uniref:hypothetical protein n=1 Tax=unclassified Pseudomonas TaxID=196821 RepID=UPI000A1F6F66|nr:MULTISPECIES: hypothetical protein [unclassified Pseudomonas]
MSNYIVINESASLIISVIASSTKPTNSVTHRFIPVSDAILTKYYRLADKNRNGTLVGAGELAAISPAFLEMLADR